MQNTIKLRISGNPISQAGFNPLINKGVIPQGIIEEDRPIPISDNPSICLCHKDNLVLYLLHDAKVVPSDAERDGRLTILMAIPKDCTIQNGESPYKVLMEIYKFFVDNCMTTIEGSEIKRFKSTNEILSQAEDCRNILSKYELEAISSEFHNMSPDGIAATLNVPINKLHDFFSDTQYPEFRKYKEIYITTQDKSSEALAGLTIPREKEYEIWVNDRFQQKGRLIATTPINSSGGLNSEDITYDPVSVTLQELIEAEGNKMTFGQSTAELNLKTRRIILKVPPIKIYYKLEFKFEGDADGIKKVKQYLESGRCKLLIDEANVSKEVENPDAKIAPSKTKGEAKFIGNVEGFIVTTRINRDIVDKKGVITLNISKRQIREATNGGRQPRTMGNIGNNGKNILAPVPGVHGNSKNSDYEERLPEPKKKKSFKFLIWLFIGLLLGFILGFALRGCESENEPQPDNPLTEEVENLKDENDKIKNENEALKDSIDKLTNKIKALDEAKSQNPQDSKKEDVKKTYNPDPLTEIQSCSDFADFMQLVNAREWEQIQQHEIYKALKNKGLQKYTFKIQHFCNPNGMFGANGLGKNANKAQNKKITEWKRNTKAMDLKDVSKKVDALLQELKKLQ